MLRILIPALTLLGSFASSAMAAYKPEVVVVIEHEAPITSADGKVARVAKIGEILSTYERQGDLVLVGSRTLGWIDSKAILSVPKASRFFSNKLLAACFAKPRDRRREAEWLLGMAECASALAAAKVHGLFCNFATQALKHADAAVRRDPSNLRALETRSRLLLAAGRKDDALADANRMSEIAPYAVETLLALAAVRSAAGKLEEALHFYDEAERADEADCFVRLWRAETLTRLKRRSEAKSELDIVIAANPRFDTAYCLRAMAFIEEHKYEEALADAEAAWKLSPNAAQVLLTRGVCHEHLGHLDAAMADCDAAIKTGDSNGYVLRADIWRRRGDYARALADCDKAISRGVKDSAVQYFRCDALFQLDRTRDALARAEAMIRDYPEEPAGFFGRALIRASMNDLPGAFADAQRFRELAPASANTHALLAALDQRQGDELAAAEERRLAREIDPSVEFPAIPRAGEPKPSLVGSRIPTCELKRQWK